MSKQSRAVARRSSTDARLREWLVDTYPSCRSRGWRASRRKMPNIAQGKSFGEMESKTLIQGTKKSRPCRVRDLHKRQSQPLNISFAIWSARPPNGSTNMATYGLSCLHLSLIKIWIWIYQTAELASCQRGSALAVIQALPSASPDFLEDLTFG